MKKIDNKESEKIKRELTSWLKKKKINKFKFDENLLLSGKIDSFDIINLILFCEKKFMMKFSKNEMFEKDFASLKKLVKIIELKKNNA